MDGIETRIQALIDRAINEIDDKGVASLEELLWSYRFHKLVLTIANAKQDPGELAEQEAAYIAHMRKLRGQ